jgi:hypothetical protein
MDEFCSLLASHPQADEVAQALDGVYRFVVDPAGPLTVRHTYDVEISPTANGAQVGVIEAGQQPRLTLTTDYRRWQQLVRGELDVGMAVMLRRLKVSGDLTSLMGNVSNAGPLVESLHNVDTVWLDEA